jgi:hypothetical protein
MPLARASLLCRFANVQKICGDREKSQPRIGSVQRMNSQQNLAARESAVRRKPRIRKNLGSGRLIFASLHPFSSAR